MTDLTHEEQKFLELISSGEPQNIELAFRVGSSGIENFSTEKMIKPFNELARYVQFAKNSTSLENSKVFYMLTKANWICQQNALKKIYQSKILHLFSNIRSISINSYDSIAIDQYNAHFNLFPNIERLHYKCILHFLPEEALNFKGKMVAFNTVNVHCKVIKRLIREERFYFSNPELKQYSINQSQIFKLNNIPHKRYGETNEPFR